MNNLTGKISTRTRFWATNLGFILLGLMTGSSLMADNVQVYQGLDPNVTVGSTLTSSNTAQGNYFTAASPLGTYNLITFESAPLGNFTSLNLGGGVMLTLSNANTFASTGAGISKDTTQPGLGFNTTPGGANFFRFVTKGIKTGASTTADATFSFAAPVNSFGGYFTGLGGGGDTVTLNFTNGLSEIFNLALSNTSSCSPSCAEFFGFTDSGSQVSSIDLSMAYANITGPDNLAYFIGVDDVQYTSTPEPSTLTLLGSGLLAVGRLGRKAFKKN